jgi:gelsolin
MASNIVSWLSPDHEIEITKEGEEPDNFWDALGGKEDYDHELERPGAPILDPRLFHCKVTTAGKFRVEEIGRFEQDVRSFGQFISNGYFLIFFY